MERKSTSTVVLMRDEDELTIFKSELGFLSPACKKGGVGGLTLVRSAEVTSLEKGNGENVRFFAYSSSSLPSPLPLL